MVRLNGSCAVAIRAATHHHARPCPSTGRQIFLGRHGAWTSGHAQLELPTLAQSDSTLPAAEEIGVTAAPSTPVQARALPGTNWHG